MIQRVMTTEESIALDAVKQIGINASLDTLRAADSLVKALVELFDDNTIGVTGNRNDNGADSMSCDNCGAHLNVQGYVSTYNHHILAIEHNPACKSLALYELIQSLTSPTP